MSIREISCISGHEAEIMVKYTIYMQAELERVTSLQVNANCDICVSVRNPLNAAEHREKVVLEGGDLVQPQVESHEKHRNEHPYHFALKWDGATTRSTARILDSNKKISKYKLVESGKFCPILELECDGLEPYEFHPLGNEFQVEDKAGKIHSPVDLSSGDWSTYEIATGSTSVLNVKFKIE